MLVFGTPVQVSRLFVICRSGPYKKLDGSQAMFLPFCDEVWQPYWKTIRAGRAPVRPAAVGIPSWCSLRGNPDRRVISSGR